MASIQERKSANGKVSYRVQIRLKGHPVQTATFERKTDAKKWVSETESAIREGRYFKTNESRRRTLAEMCDRYVNDVLPSKSASLQRGQKQQLAWWKSRIGYYSLSDVSPALIADQRDYLAKNGSHLPVKEVKGKQASEEPTASDVSAKQAKLPTPATVVRYLAALSAAFSHAVDELGWIDTNPMPRVKKPREPKGRIRFLSDEERSRLLDACRKSKNRYLIVVVMFALSTGARSGEIMGLKWEHIDFERHRAVLFDTKNREDRAVSLHPQLVAELERLYELRIAGAPFVFASSRAPSKPMELRTPWHVALAVAKIKDFRFHDLRHTAASYLAMSGATSVELSEILGHKSLSMVKRYAHLSESHTRQVVTKMNDKLFPPKKPTSK